MMHAMCIIPEKKPIIIKNDIICNQNFIEFREASHLQALFPGQLLKVLLKSLQRTAGKHPDMSKLMEKIREKYYFPAIATFVRNWVREREVCIQDNCIKNA